MMKIKKRLRHRRSFYQCCICGNREGRPQICCGHPMIELKKDWDFFNWDIRAWKSKASRGKGYPRGD